MEDTRTTRQKLMEWVRRYLPCEIAGTIGELGGAAVAYLADGFDGGRGDHRDHRRVGRLLRDRLYQRGPLVVPRTG